MDPTTLEVTQPVAARFAEVTTPESYETEVEQLWKIAEAHKALLLEQVQQERITPQHAIQVLGTGISAVFGTYALPATR